MLKGIKNYWLFKSKNSPVKPRMSLLMGAHGRTITDVNFEGQAVIHGETWNVYANEPIENDCSIHVTGVDLKGLKLEVGEDTDTTLAKG
jgi:membrane-bound serine protease (ClpP class)